ncbi:MAG: hypothetical protein B7733_05430 [Myxococcales bacterium FL481]|nr:MAG: hypothetical protein B7733_05430 [Myxococcales bacterium FL481]
MNVSSSSRVGVLGVGKIASAVVRGLSRTQPAPSIVISPRNLERSAALAAELANVEVAASNQAVLDESQVVLLALRPNDVAPALATLEFRANHEVVSFVPTWRYEVTLERIHPATALSRATPLPPCAGHYGAILGYRLEGERRRLLAGLGSIVDVRQESHLHYLWALSGLITPLYAVMSELADWTVDAGVSRETAEQYIAEMVGALCAAKRDAPEQSLASLAQEAATPGGLNEGAHGQLSSMSVYSAFRRALDDMLPRFGEAAPHRANGD